MLATLSALCSLQIQFPELLPSFLQWGSPRSTQTCLPGHHSITHFQPDWDSHLSGASYGDSPPSRRARKAKMRKGTVFPKNTYVTLPKGAPTEKENSQGFQRWGPAPREHDSFTFIQWALHEGLQGAENCRRTQASEDSEMKTCFQGVQFLVEEMCE